MNTTNTNSTFNLMDTQLNVITSATILFIQGINFFLGIPLNIYMIFHFIRAGGLDETVIFILSQSISEILFALSAPVYAVCIIKKDMCPLNLLNFLVGFFLFACPLFQCCVCLERYLAVVHPLIFLRFKPLRYRFLIVIWTSVLPCSSVVMFTSLNVTYIMFGIIYILFLFVNVFCCTSILIVLRQPRPGERDMGKQECEKNNIKKKAFELVFFNLLIFLIQCIPMDVILSVRPAIKSEGVYNMTLTFCVAMNIGAGLMSVLFYLHKAGKLTSPRCV